MQRRHAAYLSPRAQPEPPEANPNMDNPFIGMIALFPYSFAPQDWLDCDGRLLPVNQYQALFSLLNTTYGGDGRSNFALPDLRVGSNAGCRGASAAQPSGSGQPSHGDRGHHPERHSGQYRIG